MTSVFQVSVFPTTGVSGTVLATRTRVRVYVEPTTYTVAGVRIFRRRDLDSTSFCAT